MATFTVDMTPDQISFLFGLGGLLAGVLFWQIFIR